LFRIILNSAAASGSDDSIETSAQSENQRNTPQLDHNEEEQDSDQDSDQESDQNSDQDNSDDADYDPEAEFRRPKYGKGSKRWHKNIHGSGSTKAEELEGALEDKVEEEEGNNEDEAENIETKPDHYQNTQRFSPSEDAKSTDYESAIGFDTDDPLFNWSGFLGDDELECLKTSQSGSGEGGDSSDSGRAVSTLDHSCLDWLNDTPNLTVNDNPPVDLLTANELDIALVLSLCQRHRRIGVNSGQIS
jgi:hypothetical protein